MKMLIKDVFKQCQNNSDHIILDVRTATECSQGIPKGAQCLSMNEIEDQALKLLSKDKTYHVICHGIQRSGIATTQLIKLGFKNVFPVDGGYVEWLKNELPVEIPELKNVDLRYQRHHQLKGFGRISQDKLLKSHVLIIGAGGLGSASALYLAAAGIGEISIIDDDNVSLSNLQRQILHSTNKVGQAKVDSARETLHSLNPEIKINPINARLTENNAQKLIEKADVIIDGSDNLITRYLVNNLCLTLKKPLVYAAVYQYEAQLTTFDFRKENSPCLNCLFPQTTGFEPQNCSTVGVLGVVPGIAGVMQASETIKLISGVGDLLTKQLSVIDLLTNNQHVIKYKQSAKCQLH